MCKKQCFIYLFCFIVFALGYVIVWNHKKIPVYRPDVECTNGVIHVIDYPLLMEKDIVVSGGSYYIKSNSCILLASLMFLVIVKKLLNN